MLTVDNNIPYIWTEDYLAGNVKQFVCMFWVALFANAVEIRCDLTPARCCDRVGFKDEGISSEHCLNGALDRSRPRPYGFTQAPRKRLSPIWPCLFVSI